MARHAPAWRLPRYVTAILVRLRWEPDRRQGLKPHRHFRSPRQIRPTAGKIEARSSSLYYSCRERVFDPVFRWVLVFGARRGATEKWRLNKVIGRYKSATKMCRKSGTSACKQRCFWTRKNKRLRWFIGLHLIYTRFVSATIYRSTGWHVYEAFNASGTMRPRAKCRQCSAPWESDLSLLFIFRRSRGITESLANLIAATWSATKVEICWVPPQPWPCVSIFCYVPLGPPRDVRSAATFLAHLNISAHVPPAYVCYKFQRRAKKSTHLAGHIFHPYIYSHLMSVGCITLSFSVFFFNKCPFSS